LKCEFERKGTAQAIDLMTRKHRALFITILPSPYQRDLFGALAARDDIDLSVCYIQASAMDSPWPEKPLRSFERILPGFSLPFGDVRVNVNWNFPPFSNTDVVVLSTYMSVTGQWLMRCGLRGKRWLFWGERLRPNSGMRDSIQRHLAAPISRASGIVGIGRAAEEDYQRRFPQVPHFFSIPYHCDLSPFFSLPRRADLDRPVTFLFCGQMIARKGIDVLLQAFNRLVESGLDARLLLVGREADLPKLLGAVSGTTRSKIQYEGFKPPECLAEYFGRSDVFVLPSRHDGWGVVVNQALAASLPIITSDAVGAGLDLVEDGVNGARVSAGDIDALYRAMRTFVLSPGLAYQWGENSRRKASDLTPEAGAEKWVRVFDSLRSARGLAHPNSAPISSRNPD
jgi:poly(glycerol-phosphate) alpha-glucosyltransferase